MRSSVNPVHPDDAAGGFVPPAGAPAAAAMGGEPMTRSELIDRLAERYPQLVAKDAEFAVRTILEAMARTLAAGQRIEIRGFSSFAVSFRPPRVGRNPKSGEQVMVPGKRVPHFKPGKELRERVDLVGDRLRDPA